MMATQAGAWAGADLGPLPFESDFSLNMRFAYVNGASAAGVLRSLRKYHTAISWAQVAHTASRHSWARFEVDGVSVPDADPLTSPVFTDLLLTNRLRICPVCLEAAYHSYLYQIEALQQCPLHGCQLQSFCMTCGTALPTALNWRRAFDVPYQCARCGCPYSGACTSLQQHEDLRDQTELIRRSLHPIYDWLQNVGALEFLVHYANDPEQSVDRRSQLRRELVLSAAYACFTPPDLFTRSLFQEVTVLGWSVKTFPRREDDPWRYYEASDAVTRATLWRIAGRRLDRWMYQGQHEEPQLIPKTSDKTPPDYERCLWQVLTDAWARSRESELMLRDPVPDQAPPIPFERSRGGTPRLAAFAYYLGLGAMTIWKAHHPAHCASELQPPFCATETDGVHCGWVFFPTVPGLSLKPFSPFFATRAFTRTTLSTTAFELNGSRRSCVT
ncbi:TniQ family protein [Paraburkholderia phenazinium]|nr:TniQ family protein [Paraburkholderia phenazinium]